LLKSGKSPETLISDVSSPGGTTLAGLSEFDRLNLDPQIQEVVLAAIQKSRTLSAAT